MDALASGALPSASVLRCRKSGAETRDGTNGTVRRGEAVWWGEAVWGSQGRRGWAPHPGALPGSIGQRPGSCSGLSWSWWAHLTAGFPSPARGRGGQRGLVFLSHPHRGAGPGAESGGSHGLSGEERSRLDHSGKHLFPEEIPPRLLVPALGPHPEVAHVQADGADHSGTVGRGW